jgi:AraC-like DNA-binding protein
MDWKENFDELELKEIEFNKEYFLNWRHDTPDRILRMIIAKLAISLDAPQSLDKPLGIDQLINHLKTLADKEKSDDAFAQVLGVSPSYLSMVLAGKRKPNAKLLKAIGFQQTYVKVK